MDYEYIDPDKIKELLYGDSEYLQEFCEAGQSSFEEFRDNFHKHLLDRNMEGLRKAGHKIKPGALMMGADIVVDEYENAKVMLEKEVDQKILDESAKKMDKICNTIKTELSHLSDSID